MAENKKSFILYCDLIHTVNKLPDDKAGLLFKHLLSYVNDENPITEDLLVEIAFEPIKRQLKRDLDKWEDELIQRSDAGLNSALSRLELKIKDYTNTQLKKSKQDFELKLSKDSENKYFIAALKIVKDRLTKSTTVETVATLSTDNDNVNVTDTVTSSINIDFDRLINLYNDKFGRTTRTLPKKAKKQIIERFKEGYTKTDFVNALDNAKNDQYHKDNNYKYITLEFITRPDKFERYSSNHNFKVQNKIL